MEKLFDSVRKFALSRFTPLLTLFCCSALPQCILPLSDICKFYCPPSVIGCSYRLRILKYSLPPWNIWVPVWPTTLSNSGKSCRLKRSSPTIAHSAQCNRNPNFLARGRIRLLSCILLSKVCFFQSAQEQICSLWIRTQQCGLLLLYYGRILWQFIGLPS